MECQRCRAGNPEVAHYCHRCGTDLRSGDVKRRQHYAAAPDEPVASFSLVTTIMPHGSGAMPTTYRTALMVAMLFPVVGAAIGSLTFAIVTAAFAIPVVYVVYLYDVNLWEDEPVNVTIMAFVFTAALSLGWTVLWRFGIFKSMFQIPLNRFINRIELDEMLVVCLLVPVVGTLIMQIGPLFLASRPAFDDLMDGLTFGVISGVAFAAFETLVLYRNLIIDAPLRVGNVNAGLWVSIVLTAALIKPVVYGTSTGIAAAEFSGLGDGYDGFSPRYLRGLVEALVANIVFALGIYLLGTIRGTTGALLGMVWGLAVAAALILRVRTILHVGLLEAALEATARGSLSKHSTRDIGFCPQCEMPLIDQSMFCINCGESVRAVTKVVRRQNETAYASGVATIVQTEALVSEELDGPSVEPDPPPIGGDDGSSEPSPKGDGTGEER